MPDSPKLHNGNQKMQNGSLKLSNDCPNYQNDNHEWQSAPKTVENGAKLQDSNYSSCEHLLQSSTVERNYGSPYMETPNLDLPNGGPRVQKGGLEMDAKETRLQKADSDAQVTEEAPMRDSHEKFANGGLTIQNGGPLLKNCTYHEFRNEKVNDEDSIEFEFSNSSITQSQSGAVVECTKNKS